MTLLKRGPTPYYHQIESIYRNKIASGELREGARLPSEDDLTKGFQVSRATVRQALRNLEDDGLVRREQGRGTFVMTPAGPVAQLKMTCLLEDLIALGIPAVTTILQPGVVGAPRAVAEALKLAADGAVFSFLRMVKVEDAAFSATRVYLPPWVGEKLREEDLAARNFLQTLSRRCAARAEEADQILEAIMADAGQASLLGVDAGSALLSVTRTSRDRSRQPIEHSITLYRSDRVKFMVSQRHRRTGEDDWVLSARGARNAAALRAAQLS